MPIKLFVIGLISFIFILSSGCGTKQAKGIKSVAPISQDTRAQTTDLILKFADIAKEETNNNNKYMKIVYPGSTILTISNKKASEENKILLIKLAQLAKDAGNVTQYTDGNIPTAAGNLKIRFYGDPKNRLNLEIAHPDPNTWGLKYISGRGLMIVGNQRPKNVVLMNLSP